jgi:hypothetical protein
MEGVTTAIVAFLFVCVVFPTLVKNKPQYYAAFAAIILIILLWGSEFVINSGAFRAFALFMICVLQVAALILLVLSVGGLTWRELRSEVTEAIEVIRRGETQKEVIVPLRGDAPVTAKADPLSPPPPKMTINESDQHVPLE